MPISCWIKPKTTTGDYQGTTALSTPCRHPDRIEIYRRRVWGLNFSILITKHATKCHLSLEDDIDYLIVDIPAGASDSALFFVNAVDLALIVLVAEPTSFLDAYALVKAAHLENGVTDFAVMVNMADNAKTAETNFNKFREITMRFLDIKLHYVGMVPQSPVIRRSIVQRKPISISQPKSPLAKAYESLALKMMRTSHSHHDGMKFFNGAQK